MHIHHENTTKIKPIAKGEIKLFFRYLYIIWLDCSLLKMKKFG